MKLKHSLLVLVASLLLLGVIFAAGCVETPQDSPASGETKTPTTMPTATPTAAPTTKVPAVSSGQHNDLQNTADIIDLVVKDSGDANVVISPLSLNMALGMVLAGADNTCEKEIAGFLGTTKENVTTENRELLDHYANLSNTTVAIANSFWFDNGFKLETPYKNTLKTYFDAEISQHNFKDDKTATVINNWCAEKTNNLIKEITTSEKLAGMTNVLINAVYFNGKWVNTFDEDRCKPETFKGFTEKSNVTMMHSTEKTYFENDKATGFRKPYADGISFVGILPKKEGEFTINDLNLDSLLNSETWAYDVYIGLPKFKTECTMDFVKPLGNLGFSNVFSDFADNFDEIGRTVGGDRIKIADIIQKTYIDVNEKGTEAAAVTEVGFKPTSYDPNQKQTKTVILNRPFAFLLLDDTNNQILFAGKITSVKE